DSASAAGPNQNGKVPSAARAPATARPASSRALPAAALGAFQRRSRAAAAAWLRTRIAISIKHVEATAPHRCAGWTSRAIAAEAAAAADQATTRSWVRDDVAARPG